jgi:hypothetical protein
MKVMEKGKSVLKKNDARGGASGEHQNGSVVHQVLLLLPLGLPRGRLTHGGRHA